jgi:Sigma-70 region 2
VEQLPTCAPGSRAINADVMRSRRRFAVSLPGLLARSRASPHAFGDFYEQMSPQVLRFFVRRTGDPHRAVDLTAETFARAFEHRSEFRGAPAAARIDYRFAQAVPSRRPLLSSLTFAPTNLLASSDPMNGASAR